MQALVEYILGHVVCERFLPEDHAKAECPSPVQKGRLCAYADSPESAVSKTGSILARNLSLFGGKNR